MRYRSEGIDAFKKKYPYFDFSDANAQAFSDLWDGCGLNDSSDITLENLESVAAYGIEAGVLNAAITPEHMSPDDLREHMRRVDGAEVEIPDPINSASPEELREFLDAANEGSMPVWDGNSWTRNQ